MKSWRHCNTNKNENKIEARGEQSDDDDYLGLSYRHSSKSNHRWQKLESKNTRLHSLTFYSSRRSIDSVFLFSRFDFFQSFDCCQRWFTFTEAKWRFDVFFLFQSTWISNNPNKTVHDWVFLSLSRPQLVVRLLRCTCQFTLWIEKKWKEKRWWKLLLNEN